jgi:hypothetical protein
LWIPTTVVSEIFAAGVSALALGMEHSDAASKTPNVCAARSDRMITLSV